MRTARILLGLGMLLALPLHAEGQHHRNEHRGLTGAVERLFEHRERLGMTADQLARVQAIKDTADTRKQPHWQQIITIRRALKARQREQPDMPEAERDALARQSGEQVEALLERIRDIDHAAMREVGAVLRPGQKTMLREIVANERRNRDESDRPGEGGRPGN